MPDSIAAHVCYTCLRLLIKLITICLTFLTPTQVRTGGDAGDSSAILLSSPSSTPSASAPVVYRRPPRWAWWGRLVVQIFRIRRQQELYWALGEALKPATGGTFGSDFKLSISHQWGYRLDERRSAYGRSDTSTADFVVGGPRRSAGKRTELELARRT